MPFRLSRFPAVFPAIARRWLPRDKLLSNTSHRHHPFVLPSCRMPKYRQALVTYIDFLGFKNLLDSKTPNQIIEILSSLKRAISEGRYITGTGPRTSIATFSDHVVRESKCDPTDVESLRRVLDDEMTAIGHMQYELLDYENPLLIRGGISLGLSYVTNKFAFGPAMVKAYQLEQIARFPRIVVDPDVIAAISKKTEDGGDYALERQYQLRQDRDGMFIVDYLNIVLTEQQMVPINIRGRKDVFLDMHKVAITRKLSELLAKADENLRQKGLWLMRYHNAVIQSILTKRPWEEEKYRRYIFDEGIVLGKAASVSKT
jgi:hypothetical protein